MSGTQNWREETNAGDYFLHQQKRANIADRRPVIRRAADLVGPGIGSGAVSITDANDVLATFDGYYSFAVGTANSPDSSQAHVGFVSGDNVLGGVQEFYGLTDGLARRRIFTRAPLDPTTITFSSWALVSNPQSVPVGRIYSAAQQSFAAGTMTSLTYDTSVVMSGGMTMTANGLVVPKAGVYRVTATAAIQGQTTASLVSLQINKNGSIIAIPYRGAGSPTAPTVMNGTLTTTFATGDVIGAAVQGATASNTYGGAAWQTSLEATFISS